MGLKLRREVGSRVETSADSGKFGVVGGVGSLSGAVGDSGVDCVVPLVLGGLGGGGDVPNPST